MLEELGFSLLDPRQASVLLGLLIGLLFGALAEATKLCLRRGLIAQADDRPAALGLWMVALATALISTQASVALGWIAFDEHRFLTPDLPWAAIITGGISFGAGMVLARGCAARQTVLAATGNLRALLVMVVFAIIAHATLKGALAPLRVWLGKATVTLGDAASLSALPGGALVWTTLLAFPALTLAIRAKLRWTTALAGILIGLLAPVGWVGTGLVLYDEFDPIAFETLSFTSSASETLFWTIAGTSVPASFGTGLIGGTLAGAFLSALLGKRLQWQSFESPAQTGRGLFGAGLMGLGGVLAGGCTIGAGLSGVPTLSVAALLALSAIVLGAVATDALLQRGWPQPGQPALASTG